MDIDQNAVSAPAPVSAQEPLTSPATDAQVLRYMEALVNSADNAVPIARPAPKTFNDPLAGGVLAIPPRIFREYADEFEEMARTASNEYLRGIYSEMQDMWKDAAARFETGLADEVGREHRRMLGKFSKGS